MLFHIQTEDKGLTNPFIETHVFIDGNVVATRRADYKKFVSRAGVVEIVRTMMQEQHKQMMQDIVSGKLRSVNDIVAKAPPVVEKIEASPIRIEPESVPSPLSPAEKPKPDVSEKTLDELILEYISKNRSESS